MTNAGGPYELPEGWEWTTLADISSLISGQHILKRDYNFDALGLPYLTGPADFGSKYPIISKWTTKPKAISTKNDVLITVKGAGVGKANLLNIEEAAISRQLMAVRPFYVDPNYPFTFIQFNFHNLQKLGVGSTVPGIDRESILNIQLPLPPLPEQRRIVARIEELFAQLDAGVSALETARAQLKRYRQSVLKAAVEGKLTGEWRRGHPDVEPASVLLEQIGKERRAKWEEEELAKLVAKGKRPKNDRWKQKYKEPQAPETKGLPELPEGWCYTLLEPHLLAKRNGMKTGPFGSLLKKHEHQQSGVPVLGIENIKSMKFVPGSKIHITKEKADQLSDYNAQPGDILISRSGTVGEICVVPDGLGETRISTNLMRVSLIPGSILPHFFCLLFNGSPFVLNQVSELCKGSTRDFLNQHILSSIIFPLPPLAEQHEIVSEIERLLTVADQTEATIAASLKRAARLRQSILKNAFRGDLVSQDPNDEPASLLLERIMAERAKAPPKGRKARPRKKKAAKTTKPTKPTKQTELI